MRQLVGAIAPPLPAAALAAGGLWLLEKHVLHSDTRPVLVAIAFLAMDAVAFAAVCLVLLRVFARSAMAELTGMIRQFVTAVRTRRNSRVDAARTDSSAR